MARITVMARWLELGIGVIGPYIGRLHSEIPVLTICDRIAGHKTLSLSLEHEIHLAQRCPGILNEKVSGSKFLDKFQDMIVRHIAELGIFRLGSKSIPNLFTVVKYRRYRI